MTSLLVTGIGELTTNVVGAGDDPADATGLIRDAAIRIEDGIVAWVGRANDAEAAPEACGVERVVDAGGRAVVPGFVDSHTHLVFSGDRADEFEARMAGVP